MTARHGFWHWYLDYVLWLFILGSMAAVAVC
jgi:hypothetical protein